MDMKKHFEQGIMVLLRTQTIDDIKVSKIVEEVGACKGTLYKYYLDKYDLCNKAIESFVYSNVNFDAATFDEFFLNYIQELDKHRVVFVNACHSADVNSVRKLNADKIMDMLVKFAKQHRVSVEDPVNHFVFRTFADTLTSMVLEYVGSQSTKSCDKFMVYVRAVMPRIVYSTLYSVRD